MVSLITKPTEAKVLEPSAGKGVFIKELFKNGYNDVIGLEIDPHLIDRSQFPEDVIKCVDFFEFTTTRKFDVIIGNPPYIRWKNQPKEVRERLINEPFWGTRMNGLSDYLQPFIFKSIDLLEENGELIFLTPRFWLQTKHAAPLREYLLHNGFLECLIDFNENTIISGVNLNFIIFKFRKSRAVQKSSSIKVVLFKDRIVIDEKLLKDVLKVLQGSLTSYKHGTDKNHKFEYLKSNHPLTTNRWTFNSKEDELILHKLEKQCSFNSYSNFISRDREYVSLGDVSRICNGMVSGADKAFRVISLNGFGVEEQKFIIKVIKARDLDQYYSNGFHYYIKIPEGQFQNELEFAKQCPSLFKHLSQFKELLVKRWVPPRKIVHWWEWAFPRNEKTISKNKKKILVPCKERFDKKQFFRFAYSNGDFLVKQDVTAIIKHDWVKESYYYLVAYLNSQQIFNWITKKGLKRGGVIEFSQKPLAEVPVRLINWQDSVEVEVHDQISALTKEIIDSKEKIENNAKLEEINHLLGRLLD